MRSEWLVWAGLFFALLSGGNSAAQVPDLYAPGRVIEVRIEINRPDWRDVLDSLKSEKIKDRIVADLWVDGVPYRQVGLRYKGNSSYNSVSRKGKEKLPFNIKIDHLLDEQALPGGYTKLKLSNVFRDPSFLREALAYEIAGNYMPAPRANYARVYINDDYYGLYNSTESVDERFLERYFGYGDGILFKCDPEYGAERPAHCPDVEERASLRYLGPDPACYHGLYELKSDSGWAELVDLARALHEQPDSIERLLNVDLALWMLAFDNCIVNLDSYLGEFCHNYYLYRDTFGQFHSIIWDMNMAFGGFRLDGLGNHLDLAGMQQLSMFIHYKQNNDDRPLITQLLRQDLYRKVYVAHIRTMLEEFFLSGRFEDRVRELHDQLQPLVAEDDSKLYSEAAFHQNLTQSTDADGVEIVGLLELMNGRVKYLSEHPLLQKQAPRIGRVGVAETESGEAFRFTAEAEGAERLWLMQRDGPFTNFSRFAMEPDSKGGGRWSLVLPVARDAQYYFIAEGKTHASLLPARASFEAFTLSEQLEKQ
jgi:hypothetical protein